MSVHVFQRHVDQFNVLAQRLASTLGLQQFATIHNVAPVVLARIGNRQNDLAVGS